MLTSDTKRHIDAARQVLVGVVPNPAAQIEQVTNALIYKFMDDMDQAAVKAGDEASFFTGDLERYAWTRLMDTRMGNQERMNLYSEALIKFSESKQLPQLFRDIFKSAFLPYRSPEVLGLFLKEIAYFDYSHSEELGNAYEYLLSIMSSQGDAGQFRTPRHIIDFIVEVVNPTKDDKILDPACGTAGFLISAYKHILAQHDGKNAEGIENKEKSLTPDQRRTLLGNFEGYDIDPSMVRIAQVNMYLHQFKNPKIYSYNTLADDDRWSDKFDVILANPPFMSPKGGVSTHNKFSIESSRSEVLFVDYIMNHLRPRGRAGVIVPEGVIFQSGKGHTQLRKNLVADGLWAVISLPQGVFNPYSGVKTSILLFDNELSKKSSEIIFVKITNDGFDLGANKREIKGEELTKAREILNAWKDGRKTESALVVYVEKIKITEPDDFNLSGDRFRVIKDYGDTKWPIVKIGEHIKTITPPQKIQTKDYGTLGSFPIIDQSQEDISGWTNDVEVLVSATKPLVIFGDHTCSIKYSEKSFAQGADGIKILQTTDDLLPKFLYSFLKAFPIGSDGYKRHYSKLSETDIPLPPLEVQQQIVEELDGYQKIISGARQIVENWKPRIEIEPEWQKVKLGDVCVFENGDRGINYPSKSNRVDKGIPFINAGHLTADGIDMKNMDYISRERFDLLGNGKIQRGDILFCLRGSLGKYAKVEDFSEGAIASSLVIIRPKESVITDYLMVYFGSSFFANMILESKNGVAQPNLAAGSVKNFEIPLPPLVIQKNIIEKIETERVLVEAAKKLIGIYEGKTKETLTKLWEE